jgi:hypothetical protein
MMLVKIDHLQRNLRQKLTKYAFVWWQFEVHTAPPRTLEITYVLILIRVEIILVLLRGDRHI